VNLAARLLAPGSATERPALVTPSGTRSRAELAAAAAALAAAIGDRTRADARVAILADSDEHFVAAYLGVLGSGRVAVPMNHLAPLAEQRAELGAVEPELALCGPGIDAAAASAIGVPVLEIAGHRAAGNADGDNGYGGAGRWEPVDRSSDDLAVLLFTSGTAGMPKAAMLSHGNLLANIDQVQSCPGLAIRADDIGLGVLPFFHVFGLNVVLGLSLAAGASVICLPRFDPTASLAAVREHGVTVIAAVPAVYRAWLDVQGAPRDAFASVRLAVSGAAALDVGAIDALAERFGLHVHEGYGLTEAAPIVSTTAVERTVRPGSIGPPLPGVVVRLADADGSDVLAGDPGEILVRGDNVFLGYWHDPAQTARVLRDGWLHTGDIAVADDDGWLTLVDRAKDLVIVSGFNVYPGEVEAALVEHDDVVEAAVVGEPDPRAGERVVAFVVTRPGTAPTATMLTAHLRRRLARYKIPQRFEFVDSLPHTFAGKVLRRALRDGNAANEAIQKPA
jgi:long-chain acyl-CoA synthetase